MPSTKVALMALAIFAVGMIAGKKFPQVIPV